MENGASVMSDQAVVHLADAEITSLARETNSPVELVHEIYFRERAKLEKTARIKTFVPVLIHRHVKALLRERRASS
jgi:Protein of unknown function (DUF3562)